MVIDDGLGVGLSQIESWARLAYLALFTTALTVHALVHRTDKVHAQERKEVR